MKRAVRPAAQYRLSTIDTPVTSWASAPNPGAGQCAYKGYKTMCFTDKTDAMTPFLGYLPGKVPWKCEAALVEKGVQVMNKSESGATMVDRELITGDSPDAANNLGILAAPLIVQHAMDNGEKVMTVKV